MRMLDHENIDHRIMIAELYRGMGNFTKCIEIVSSISDPKLDWLKEGFIEECDKGNKLVFKLRN